MDYAQSLLKDIGLEPERVGMVNLSAAMSGAFVKEVEDLKNKISKLGYNPLRSSQKESEP